ncbi:MAG TPA: xanthine dehydrogenase family protein molybdopterin-binding subunit [Burkholderiales bacterium]|nr:xanthine dehydrogenase family protein molybdopterin-binding subunit [Burkholderiales bacterium]
MSSSGSIQGRNVGRLEDLPLLRGEGRFIDDIRLPGTLHAAFVRSPHAHAVIRGIDKTAALALDGVKAVLTLDDLRPYLWNERLVVGLPSPSYRQERNRPALAGDEAVHVGEPIAMVVASSRYVAEDAVALVAVDYDPLPAAVDCRAALAADAPPVHREGPHNLLAEFSMGYGDVERAFAGAVHVFRDSFWQHRGGSHSIECRGAVAVHDAIADKLTLWCSTQMPHALMRVLVDMLGREESRLRVMTPDLGGGFGPKLVSYSEDVVTCIAALITGSPVKWIEDRREHFVATTQERDQYWEMEIAVDADARILGVRGSFIHDHGAYTARGVNLGHNSAETVTLPYEVPAYHMTVRLALTNKVPVTPVRGAGHPQGTFAMERLLDRVARELGLDRAEVRRRNLIPASKMPYTKQLKTRGGMQVVLDSGDYPRCQQEACARAGWDDFRARQEAARREGRYIGIGLANFVKGTGRGPFEGATVRVGPSGRVHVSSGATAMGQSTRTMLAQVVAEQLGGDMANITVTTGDTDAIPMGIGGSNSRQTVTAGSSAHLAAMKVRRKAIKVAAILLKAAEQDLEIVGSEIRVKGAPQISIGLGRVAHTVAGTPGYALPGEVEPGMEATEYFVVDDMAYANGSAVAEVEVDVETGAVRIRRYVLAHDCGRIIHPAIVDGQILGGVAHGVGNALYEWMGFDETGQPATTNFGEYLLVTATEMPPVEIIHQESPSPLNPLGVKGVGECGVVPAPAAIISAIEDALTPFKVRLAQTPIFPAQLCALIRREGNELPGQR